MKLSAFSAATTLAFVSLCSGIITMPAHAESPAIQLAQAQYDIWTNEEGRTFLIDPYTGEIVREVFRERRLTRREERQLLRRERRERRLGRLEGELDRLFNGEPRDDRYQYDDEIFEERPRGRYLDEYDDGVEPRLERRELPEAEPRQAAPRDQQQDVARLPQQEAPQSRSAGIYRIPKPNYSRTQMAKLQVVLDRAGFSPGVIDGKWGSNVANAMAAWTEARGDNRLHNSDNLAAELQNSGGPAFYDYTLTQSDISGPFAASIPVDYGEKAQLSVLSYTSVQEKLAERFHMSEAYLRELNQGKSFVRSGETIRVVAPGAKREGRVYYIVADKGREQVRAYDRNGVLVTAYPATIGSASTPSPTGVHSVERIAINPEYTYNPRKNFQQGDNDRILTIAPGPNGPVGSVWIALSKPTYGIHGTPNPDTIGKTNSHGCIRLTNWDAQELAKMVAKGVKVEFVE
ncbi:MAG: L,D-transpeptidase [Ahrensia sp.]|nr:L,D-transpeptidase [Ahrensia sp.]